MNKDAYSALSEVNDALVEHLRWLSEKRDLDALAKLIPIVDMLTTTLIRMHEPEAR